MGVTGISSLAALISKQSLGQGQDTPVGTQTAPTQNASGAVLIEDVFTPSNQDLAAPVTAQDAGLFQVTQPALTQATAAILSGQTATDDTITPQAAAPAPANLQAQVAAAGPPPIVILQAAPAANANTNADTQAELQALNGVLIGFGLSFSDIQYIDLLATSAKVFNPTLYGDLVQHFEAQAAQQRAATAGVSTQPGKAKAAGA